MKPLVEIQSDLDVDFADRLLKFTYEDTDGKKDKVRIEVDNEDLTLLDDYPPGAMLAVRWGYPGNLTPWHVVQLNKVTGFEVLTFEGNSTETVLDRVERTEAYYGGTYSQIVRGIAETRYGLTGAMLHVEDTDTAYDLVNQIGETDAAFLRRLAAEVGFKFWIDDTGLHWHAAQYGEAPVQVIQYRREDGVVLADPRLEFDLQRHFRKVKKKATDPESKGEEEAEEDQTTDTAAPELGTKQATDTKKADPLLVKDPATGEFIRVPGGLSSVTPGSPAYKALPPAMQRAAFEASVQVDAVPAGKTAGQAKKQKRTLAPQKIKFTLPLVGDPSYRAKRVYRIEGLPPMLEGNWYCPKALHEVADGYTVTMDFQKQNVEKNPKKGKLEETQGQANTTSKTSGGSPKLVKDPDSGLWYEYPPGWQGPI